MIDALRVVVNVLANTVVMPPRELLETQYQNIQDPEFIEILIKARATFLKLLGGKKLVTDLTVLINGIVIAIFYDKFPESPRMEPNPVREKLIGCIHSLSQSSFELQTDHGRITVDFVPDQSFQLLKNRFCYPSISIKITAEGAGDFARVALNSIDLPLPGTLPGEDPRLFD